MHLFAGRQDEHDAVLITGLEIGRVHVGTQGGPARGGSRAKANTRRRRLIVDLKLMGSNRGVGV